MNSKTVLQVPIDISLRNQALKVAEELGFSSLKETIRVFLRKLANRSLTVTFEETETLSPAAEKRYAKMIKEVESGRVKTKSSDNVEELMTHLNS